MQDAELRQGIRSRLQQAFGPRFRGVLLYGSRARGDADADSDMDLMVLLDGPIALGRDIEMATLALRPVRMRLDYPIQITPADVKDFESQDFAIYRSAKREGVRL